MSESFGVRQRPPSEAALQALEAWKNTPIGFFDDTQMPKYDPEPVLVHRISAETGAPVVTKVDFSSPEQPLLFFHSCGIGKPLPWLTRCKYRAQLVLRSLSRWFSRVCGKVQARA